ncbi:replicative DNA helicase [Maritalea porphyrae]|uniref:replicative DNA helicase n=1 Tax=Maritalea porphyrae TaxID=880732 RepID=UPI0022AEB435|nr:DnaB-like helicase C-terminal domain-containing protein [Maritalea porphyrae]MCZ4270917.1 DnaB-like helicase C-terminal domain-containing protein [Maritalea porphyrae]
MTSTAPFDDPEIERTLIGSFINAPKSIPLFANKISAEWFSEEVCARLWERLQTNSNEGEYTTYLALLNSLPEQLAPDVKRGDFMAHIMALALPITQIDGLIRSLKRLWARRVIRDNADGIKREVYSVDCDPFALASDLISVLDYVAAGDADQNAGTFKDGAHDLLRDIDNPDLLAGATTGIKTIDEALNGYKKQQLYVIAGRPGMGKSAFALSSLRQTALNGHGVVFFSLEMSQQQLAARMLSDTLYDRFGVPAAPTYRSILRGELRSGQRNSLNGALESMSNIPFMWDASAKLTMADIKAKAREEKTKFEKNGFSLDVVCIDHMQIVEPSSRYAGNKVAEASEVSNAARAMAKELDCCVVLLCQLSRQVESRDDKRPMMSDLRWSGEIEQDANVIGFLYRDHYYLKMNKDTDLNELDASRDKLEFLVRKNRDGDLNDILLHCSVAHNAVREIA